MDPSDDFQAVGGPSSGIAALNLPESLRPGLVIAGVNMPDGDGLDVALFVRRQYPDIKITLVSGLAESRYERLAKEEGALAFIPKINPSLEALEEGG